MPRSQEGAATGSRGQTNEGWGEGGDPARPEALGGDVGATDVADAGWTMAVGVGAERRQPALKMHSAIRARLD